MPRITIGLGWLLLLLSLVLVVVRVVGAVLVLENIAVGDFLLLSVVERVADRVEVHHVDLIIAGLAYRAVVIVLYRSQLLLFRLLLFSSPLIWILRNTLIFPLLPLGGGFLVGVVFHDFSLQFLEIVIHVPFLFLCSRGPSAYISRLSCR